MPINPLYALFGGKLKEESAVSPEGIPYTQYSPKSRLLDVFLNKGRDTQAARDYNVANRAALYNTASAEFLRKLQDQAAMERMQLGESEAMNRLKYGETEASKRQQAGFSQAEKMASIERAAREQAAMNEFLQQMSYQAQQDKYIRSRQADERAYAEQQRVKQLQQLGQAALSDPRTRSQIESSFLETPTPEQTGLLLSTYPALNSFNETQEVADIYAQNPELRKREVLSRGALSPNAIYPTGTYGAGGEMVTPPYMMEDTDPKTMRPFKRQIPSKIQRFGAVVPEGQVKIPPLGGGLTKPAPTMTGDEYLDYLKTKGY